METSATKTPNQLLAEMRAIALQYAELSGSSFKDTKEPILPSTGNYDVRVVGGEIVVALSASFGWVAELFSEAGTLDLIGRLFRAQAEALAVRQAHTESIQVKNSGLVQ